MGWILSYRPLWLKSISLLLFFIVLREITCNQICSEDDDGNVTRCGDGYYCCHDNTSCCRQKVAAWWIWLIVGLCLLAATLLLLGLLIWSGQWNLSRNAGNAANPSKRMKDEESGAVEIFAAESDEGFNSDNKMAIQSPSQLTAIEELFIAAAEKGDIQSMEEALANKDRFNINATDVKGRTALRIAIENGHIGIIDMLLKQGVKIGDCLLYAVNYEFYKAVELLLNHSKEKSDDPPSGNNEKLVNRCASEDNGDFHPDISPLVLACHHNNLDIVKLLNRHGAQEIKVDYTKTLLERSLGNYHKNKALASEAYIALGGLRLGIDFVDPIDGAFEMCVKMRKRSVIEHEFRKEYLEIAMKCEQFAADLLGLTRNYREAKTILTYDPSGNKENTDSPKMVSTALSKGQKQFVAHPHCQQFLIEKWYEDFHEWRQGSLLKNLAMSLLIGLLFPIFSIIYLIVPYGMFGKFMRRPYVKFIMHTSSYMTFLLLLFLNSRDYSDADTDRKYKNGEIAFLPLEYVILTWVLAMTWREIKEFQSHGHRSYLTDPWNLVDFIQLGLYWTWFCLRIAGFIDANNSNESSLSRIAGNIFACANIISIIRFIRIMLIHEHVGPLQISVVKIVVDILRFLFIFGVIWLAFALGMTQIYLQDVTEENLDRNNTSYSSLGASLVSLYWSLYGLTELDTLDTKNDITEQFGRVVFAAYHIIALIILLNLLIALMSTTYERIVENADTEWKFARSEMWMSHFVRGATLPPPFNIVPSPKSVFRIFRFLSYNLLCRKRGKDFKKKKQESVNQKREAYKELCRQLIHRYFSVITTSAREKDDAKEIKLSYLRSVKQDIATFRFEVYGMMQKMMDRLNGLQSEVGLSNDKNTTVVKQVLQLEAALSKSKLVDSEFARAMQSQLTSARSQSDEAMKILERSLSENQEQYRLRATTMGSDMLHELRKCLSSTHIDEEATVFQPETSPVVVETMNLQQASPKVVDMRESFKMEEPGKESRETEVQTDHSGPIWINQERIERVEHTTAKDTGGKTIYGDSNSDDDDSDGYTRDVDGEGSLDLLDVEVFKDEERDSREKAISQSGTQDELVLTAADVDKRLATDVSMHTPDESPSLPSEAKEDYNVQSYNVLGERIPSLTDTETSETATSTPKRHSVSFEVPKPVLYRKASNPEDLRVEQKVKAIEMAGHPAAVVDEDATDDNITFEESFIPGLFHDTKL